MIGSDDIFITVNPNINIGVIGDGETLGVSPHPVAFKFSELNGGFRVHYRFEIAGEFLGKIVRNASAGERWELA